MMHQMQALAQKQVSIQFEIFEKLRAFSIKQKPIYMNFYMIQRNSTQSPTKELFFCTACFFLVFVRRLVIITLSSSKKLMQEPIDILLASCQICDDHKIRRLLSGIRYSHIIDPTTVCRVTEGNGLFSFFSFSLFFRSIFVYRLCDGDVGGPH